MDDDGELTAQHHGDCNCGHGGVWEYEIPAEHVILPVLFKLW